MAALKLFVLIGFLFLVLTGIIVDADASISDVGVDADASIPVVQGEPRSDGPDSIVSEKLNSKISSLEFWNGVYYVKYEAHRFGWKVELYMHVEEFHIEEKNSRNKNKDAVIAAKEKIIQEKSESIVSLKSEVASLQEKGKLDTAKQVDKAHARARELEEQVEKLKSNLDVQIKEKEQLKARESEADRKASQLSSKVESLQKIIDNQKAKLRKTERALQIAEEEIMKAKLEATSKSKELMEVSFIRLSFADILWCWLPPWLAVHFMRHQALLEKHWKVHVKPALEPLMQKAIEKKAQAQEWAAPHLETMKTKWVPVIKEKWVVVSSNVEPHVRTLSARTIEIYESSKSTVTPHIIRVGEFLDPYFQELRKVSKPYIDQVATATRPHVDTLRSALKPYTQEAVDAYGKFLKSATIYHRHVQDRVEEKLKSHELTEPWATKELARFAASVLLALPVIFLLRTCASIFCKKEQKPIRYGSLHQKGNHAHFDKLVRSLSYGLEVSRGLQVRGYCCTS
ncbi:hypothetical protein Sango_1213800 [Sesamum angolense]|uniref:Uncharacterized protein n=1 Tax=Sesamum angolense TaxID=2727404 RepID=A0AAE1WWS2_9LAMI|nr:hypothetical protein Sango_1213800 [Sesamum angolense]